MNSKGFFHYCLAVTTGFMVLLLSVACGDSFEISPDTDTNLLNRNLVWMYPTDGADRFKQLVTSTDLSKYFKPGPVNRDYINQGNPWIGRIRDNDVSYNALFTIDQTSITLRVADMHEAGLFFSVFHPGPGKRVYSVSIAIGKTVKKIFEKSFTGKTFFDGYVPLNQFKGQSISIKFHTSGNGVGAWVNPRFHKVKEKPRVFIVMVLDTLRYDHTSVYGYSRPTTPNLEKLALDGVTYDHAFSSTSWTLPSHVSLFSGKDLSQHGVVGPGNSIPADLPLMAEIFQQNGYVTAAFTGGGFVEDSYGFHRGFQYYSNAPGNVFSMNSAERVFNHFKNYVSRYWGSDLFIFLHTYQIHAPYKAPRKYIEKISPGLKGNLLGIGNYHKEKKQYYKALPENARQGLIDLYDASILYTDDVLLGGVVRFLKEKGVYNDTMLMVLSDHGEEFFDHGSWEHGHTLYNELIKIPLVIKFPLAANVEKGAIQKSLASITDLAGLMLKHSDLEYDPLQFTNHMDKPDRVLPVLFPVSPIITQFPTKASLVDSKYHYIFNMPGKEKNYFNPAPSPLPVYELYERKDLKETRNMYKKKFRQVNRFRKKMKTYLNRLKQMKRKGRKLDRELEKKLKSLGYLGN